MGFRGAVSLPSQKAIEMLAGDLSSENRKKAIRDSAEQKIAKLKFR